MSWLGRLFRSSPTAPPAAPPPAAHTVVIPEDIAARLTDGSAGGQGDLTAAVLAVLRAHVERPHAADPPAEPTAAEPELRADASKPFWLARDAAGPGAMDAALRDRITQRRAAEDDR